MSVAKVVEIRATSPESFEDAIRRGIDSVSLTVHNIKGAWVAEQKVTIENGKINGYRVDMRVAFVLD